MIKKKTNYITPDGFKKLQDEYDWYQKIERPRICNIVSWAASLGDRSENADYQYGKKRLREIDSRMRFLNGRIANASIVDPEIVKSEKVQFGATVKIIDVDGNKKVYSIVGIDETDSAKGYISWISPVAKVLLGKEVGDEVTVLTPKGNIDFEILEINYSKLLIGEFKC